MSIVLPANDRQRLKEGDKVFYCISMMHGARHNWLSGTVTKSTKTQVTVQANNNQQAPRKFLRSSGMEVGERRSARGFRGFNSNSVFLTTEQAYTEGREDNFNKKAMADARTKLEDNANALKKSPHLANMIFASGLIEKLATGMSPVDALITQEADIIEAFLTAIREKN